MAEKNNFAPTGIRLTPSIRAAPIAIMMPPLPIHAYLLLVVVNGVERLPAFRFPISSRRKRRDVLRGMKHQQTARKLFYAFGGTSFWQHASKYIPAMPMMPNSSTNARYGWVGSFVGRNNALLRLPKGNGHCAAGTLTNIRRNALRLLRPTCSLCRADEPKALTNDLAIVF